MTTRRVAALGLLLLPTACSGSSGVSQPTTAATSPATADSGPTITIKAFRYTSQQVAPGTTITVRNLDDTDHTVTSDISGQFKAADVKSGTPTTFTAPTKPGSYAFHCDFHPSMHGSLTVT
jgi:plastocyanin